MNKIFKNYSKFKSQIKMLLKKMRTKLNLWKLKMKNYLFNFNKLRLIIKHRLIVWNFNFKIK